LVIDLLILIAPATMSETNPIAYDVVLAARAAAGGVVPSSIEADEEQAREYYAFVAAARSRGKWALTPEQAAGGPLYGIPLVPYHALQEVFLARKQLDPHGNRRAANEASARAQAAAAESEAARKRAAAAADSADAAPLMEEIRALRAAQARLDDKFAELASLRADVSRLQGSPCIQCSIQ
jgi:hypothetical protein